mgnify:FL=1
MIPSQFMKIDNKEKALIIALIHKHSEDLKNIRKEDK